MLGRIYGTDFRTYLDALQGCSVDSLEGSVATLSVRGKCFIPDCSHATNCQSKLAVINVNTLNISA
jgi:hypothetical protein